MAVDTIYTQIEENLASPFSIDKFFGNEALWDAVVNSILALPATGSHAMQLDGRLDVASWNIYGTRLLDWVLAVYNGVKHVGSDEVLAESANIPLSVAKGTNLKITALIRKQDLAIAYDGQLKIVSDGPDGSKQADLNGNGIPDVRFVWNESGTVTVYNIGTFDWTIEASFFRYFTDTTLMAGQVISYPSVDSIRFALENATAKVAAQSFTGFARL